MPQENQEKQCYHCGLPISKQVDYHVQIEGKQRAMCCKGCEAVAQAIVDNDLLDYYHFRTENATTGQELVPDILKQLDLYDNQEVQRSFVERIATQEGDIRQAALIMEGIVCAACVWLNEKHINQLPGVLGFSINYSTHRARVKWDNNQLALSDILKAISNMGYIAHPFDPGKLERLQEKERSQARYRIAVAGLAMIQVMMFSIALYSGDYYVMDRQTTTLLRWISLLFTTPVIFYAALPFFQSAWKDLRRHQWGMDVPVSIALGSAYFASVWATITQQGEVYFDSVTMFTLFLLLGRYLEMAARQKAGKAAEELIKLLPAMATKLTEQGGEQQVAVAELQVHDKVRVKPGESIPADGIIIAGESGVDEALLTGESLPVNKYIGDQVIAASVNIHSPLVIEINKVGQDTVLSAIIRLLDRATSEKPNIAKIADKVASYFVITLLILVSIVGMVWFIYDSKQVFEIVLSMLVVTCPCALSLATPAAVAAASSALTQQGILITRGHVLESLAKVDTVIFDKTGTLTEGNLAIEDIVVMVEGFDISSVLRIAASVEQGSEHPVAKALQKAYQNILSDLPYLEISEQKATAGKGIHAKIAEKSYYLGNYSYIATLSEIVKSNNSETILYLHDGEQCIAQFIFSDNVRQEAKASIVELQEMGIQTLLLSGDNDKTVAAIAEKLHIQTYYAEQMPENKLQHLNQLQQQGKNILMVGDGVNDAPILAAAQVSMAMGQGTEIAQASADIILLSNHLLDIPASIKKSRQTWALIKQNLYWALFYNLTALPLAGLGLIAPWMAAIGMSFSSLLVVLNALRLL